MATTRQKKLAEVIIENTLVDKPLNAGQMLEKVGYSKSVAKAKSDDIINSEGVQEALYELGFTEANAKNVVTEILLNPDERAETRLNAAKEVFKVVGSYAPEKSTSLTLNLDTGLSEEEKNNLLSLLK